MICAPVSLKKHQTTSSPCIKPCVCWEFLDKPCGNVSSAARSKLFTSDADGKKACASRSSALNPTSSIKLHKLGCSMKHHPSILSHQYRAPSRIASSADGLGAPHRSQICRVGSRRSQDETPAPESAPGIDGRLPGQCGRRQLECPTAASHPLFLEYRPAAPAEESSSLRTCDSRVCRGCPKGWPQTPQSIVHLLQPLLGSPSHV